MPFSALIALSYRAADEAIAAGLRERGFDLRATHSAVMANIDVETGSRPTVLATRAAVSKQAIGEVVADLEKRGFVKRSRDPTDGRARLVQLTVKGRSAIEAAWEIISDLHGELEDQVGKRNTAVTTRSLQVFLQIAQRRAGSSEEE